MAKWNVGEIRDFVALRTPDLDKNPCPCGCKERLLGSNCHPDAPFLVAYEETERVLLFVCAECHRFILKVKVAE